MNGRKAFIIDICSLQNIHKNNIICRFPPVSHLFSPRKQQYGQQAEYAALNATSPVNNWQMAYELC